MTSALQGIDVDDRVGGKKIGRRGPPEVEAEGGSDSLTTFQGWKEE